MIQVKTFYAYNDLRNFSYLLFDDNSADAWVIDPFEATPIISFLKGHHLNLCGILNTHQHFDHIRGNLPLLEAFKSNLRHLKNHEQLSLNLKYSLEIIDTPGHTLDHQVFIMKSEDHPLALFSGDTLFNSGVGNCKNGGNVELLFETTQKLMADLPKETLLYPGHDYLKRNLEFALNVEPDNLKARLALEESEEQKIEDWKPLTLAHELEVNPFLRLNSEQIRENIMISKDQIDLREKEVFISLRKRRDVW